MSTVLLDETILSTEEEVLAYTQAKRKKLVEHLSSKGIPDDKGDKAILLQALADMDKPALVKLRIKSEDKNAGTNAQAALAIASLMTQMSPKKLVNFDPTVIPPTLDDGKIPDFEYVEGQTLLGTQGGSYSEFMKIHGNIET